MSEETPVRKRSNRRRGDMEPETAEKIAEALRLQRDFGYSKEKVAEVMGISSVYAGRLVKKGIQQIFSGEAKDVIEIEVAKLNKMYADTIAVLEAEHLLVNAGAVVTDYVVDAAGNYVLDGEGNRIVVRLRDHGPRLAAIDRLLKITESKRKLLGLDKPTKIAPTNPDGDEPLSLVQVYLPDNGRA